MLELVFALEETLGIEIDETQVPNWIDKEMTLGKWIKEFIEFISKKELEEAYRKASTEVDEDWDMTIGDGLS
ncbi:hypothetical protein cce_1360 [Crocosphaera subtropica ATCC 51142]|uniref:Carrier domain-containing protein n=1 Tax=Crocosphaera subtropica (strain ATCC 51142 / BH68) TaxID=43989 RepID=B1WWI6_CROS5|nr:hypothetical protein [Crocosphaera subtropica]ACB50710.1 hypothetical protein cce_1360 [Crocosphaera subtropica ATCC 51142]